MRVFSCQHRSRFTSSDSLLQKRWVYEQKELVLPNDFEKTSEFGQLSKDQLEKVKTSELLEIRDATNKKFVDRYLGFAANYEELKEKIAAEKEKDKKNPSLLKSYMDMMQKMEGPLSKLQEQMGTSAENLAGQPRENLLRIVDEAQKYKMEMMTAREAGTLEKVSEVVQSNMGIIQDIKHIFLSKQGGFFDRLSFISKKYGNKISLLAAFIKGEAVTATSSFRDWLSGKKEGEKDREKKKEKTTPEPTPAPKAAPNATPKKSEKLKLVGDQIMLDNKMVLPLSPKSKEVLMVNGELSLKPLEDYYTQNKDNIDNINFALSGDINSAAFRYRIALTAMVLKEKYKSIRNFDPIKFLTNKWGYFWILYPMNDSTNVDAKNLHALSEFLREPDRFQVIENSTDRPLTVRLTTQDKK